MSIHLSGAQLLAKYLKCIQEYDLKALPSAQEVDDFLMSRVTTADEFMYMVEVRMQIRALEENPTIKMARMYATEKNNTKQLILV